MKKVFLVTIFLTLSKWCEAALCDPLTDAQYRTQIVVCLNKNVGTVPLGKAKDKSWAGRWKKKIVAYRQDGGGPGSTEDIASKCLARDLLIDLLGFNVTSQAHPDAIDWYQSHIADDVDE